MNRGVISSFNALRSSGIAALGLALVVSAAGLVNPVFAQAPAAAATAPPIPRYDVRRATGPIVVDGLLDEAAWGAASAPVSLQFLWEQQTGAKQPTLVRLLWDDEYLYVAYDAVDADITASFLNRDDPVYRDDALEIFVNPRPSQLRTYYGLEINARGVMYDYLLNDSTMFFKHFDMAGLKIAPRLRGTLNERSDTDQGWTLEVAIPWANFEVLSRRPQVGAMWTANLNRWDGVAPDRRMTIWSDPLVTRVHPHFPSRFGELHFVE
jgi:hypothetical protein